MGKQDDNVSGQKNNSWPQDQGWKIDAVCAKEQELFSYFQSGDTGLSQVEAHRRKLYFGANEPAKKEKKNFLLDITARFTNPLVVLLLVIGALSIFLNNLFSAVIIFAMAFLSVMLSYIQEHKAEKAAEKLNALVRTTVEVYRDGQVRQLPLQDLVPGDVVSLAAGDVIPADLRLLSCKELFINQASLTGESLPVEKFSEIPSNKPPSLSEFPNILFMGSSVASGTGAAIVIHTGLCTEFGKLSKKIAAAGNNTAFDQGIKDFTWLMIRAILLMVAVILVINVWDKHNFLEGLLFALAVAVGLTPETLPMIVTINLSKGALDMSRKKVVVKRLDSIQNFGAMDILCTDKTGTLTLDKVVLEKYCDIAGADSSEVLEYGYINSFYQTGLKNLLDQAVLKHTKEDLHALNKIDEIPFDFSRKMVSVVVQQAGETVLIAKGEPDHVISRCSYFEKDRLTRPLTGVDLPLVKNQYVALSRQGFRVLAVAYKVIADKKSVYSYEDESRLALLGYLAFLDPAKPTARQTIGELERIGVGIKVLTGDNELVTKKICSDIGLDVRGMILGQDLENITDAQLQTTLERTTVFARLTPLQKERIIRLLHQNGHVVGYLGDGINDAPALKAADVGISVNNAVDMAKESASIILLKKSLVVLSDGVVEGRRIFGNIIKYIRMSSSSNFGNMLSMTGASLILPFLPMAPIQILLNNFLYDLSQIGLPTDRVDAEYLQKPRKWNIDLTKKFMVIVGPVSSIFDFTTFAVLWFVFKGFLSQDLFHTGWFLESLLSQTLVIYIIRTRKTPFLQSRPSKWLVINSLAVLGIGFILPFTGLARVFGFVPPPPLYFAILSGIIFVYLILVQMVKNWFIQHFEKE